MPSLIVSYAPPTTPSSAMPSNVSVHVRDTPVDVTRLIYMLYQDVEQQINRADLKAQITLSTSAIITAMMVNLGSGVRTHDLAQVRWFEVVSILFYALFVVAMSFVVGRGISAAFPRAIKKNRATSHSPNLYFTAQIATMAAEAYADEFCEQSNDQVKRSVLGQIHSKSLVLEAKLHHVRRGMAFLAGALGLWLAARLVLLVGYGDLGMR